MHRLMVEGAGVIGAAGVVGAAGVGEGAGNGRARWWPAGLAVAALLGLALAFGQPAGPVAANGTPFHIVLSYLNGVSNWGPRNATGTAEVTTSEGEVRLTAAGLEPLPDNEEYRVWIVSSATNDLMSLGTFGVDQRGVGRLDRVLPQPIPEKPWDTMLLTVEAKGSNPSTPGDRHSIAGRFPTTASAQPNVLPNTGGNPGSSQVAGPTSAVHGWYGLSTGGLILLALLVAGAIGFGLGRARWRGLR
ncbi:MAG: anti-sigma factor [Chloroflexi bacterium]|nr:anti-sigma factor [Chloroflexota bacterium]